MHGARENAEGSVVTTVALPLPPPPRHTPKRRLKSRARVRAGWERTVESLGVEPRWERKRPVETWRVWGSGGGTCWDTVHGTFCACSGTLFDSTRGKGSIAALRRCFASWSPILQSGTSLALTGTGGETRSGVDGRRWAFGDSHPFVRLAFCLSNFQCFTAKA